MHSLKKVGITFTVIVIADPQHVSYLTLKLPLPLHGLNFDLEEVEELCGV